MATNGPFLGRATPFPVAHVGRRRTAPRSVVLRRAVGAPRLETALARTVHDGEPEKPGWARCTGGPRVSIPFDRGGLSGRGIAAEREARRATWVSRLRPMSEEQRSDRARDPAGRVTVMSSPGQNGGDVRVRGRRCTGTGGCRPGAAHGGSERAAPGSGRESCAPQPDSVEKERRTELAWRPRPRRLRSSQAFLARRDERARTLLREDCERVSRVDVDPHRCRNAADPRRTDRPAFAESGDRHRKQNELLRL